MASYNDQSQASLSSYIPQYDVKAYVGVGMQKQAQYDAGVARIQGAVDQVAGLDIIRPIDKEYLQTKMSELNTQLQGVAGGDFSNQSVVNQAMGMAGKLYKDPTIQSAVVSTANIKALMSDQKNLKDKHPELYNVQNEWYDNKHVQQYLGSQDLNASYNGGKEATRYKDYQKDLNDIIKQVSPETTVEITPDGTYQFKSTKESTVNPETLRNIVKSYISSHPEAQNQMMIDGTYQFRDYQPTQFAEHITKTAATQLKQLQDINKNYENLMSANPANPDYNNDLKKKIADNLLAAQRITTNTQNYIGLINDGKLESAKIAAFSDNLQGMYATTYQKDNIERDIKENYEATALQKFTFDRLRLQHDLITDGMELGIDGQIQPISQDSPNYASYVNSLKGKGKNPDGSEVLPLGSTPHAGTTDITKKDFTLDELQSQKLQYINANHTGILDVAEGNLRKDFYTSLDNSIDPKVKEQQFKDYKLAQYQAYSEGKPVDPMYRDYIQSTQKAKLELDGLNKIEQQANETAVAQTPIGSLAGNVLIKGINLPHPDGSKAENLYLDLAKEPEFIGELNSFVTKYEAKKKDYSSRANTLGLVGTSNITEAALNDVMSEYGNSKFNHIFKAIKADELATGRQGKDLLNQFKSGVLRPLNDLVAKRTEIANTYIKENAKGYNPQWYTFEGKKEQLDYASRVIYNELAAAGGVTNNLSGSKYSVDSHKPEDIIPLEARTDDVTGRTIYRFKVGKGEQVEEITSTSSTPLTPSNPSDYLIKYLDTHHATPTSGDAVLTTPSGKLRYQLRTSYQNPRSYKVYAIDGGSPIPIELPSINGGSNPLAAKDPTPIINALNKLDNEKNPYTNEPYSRDELLYRLAPGRTEAEFANYMRQKLTPKQ